MSRSTHPGRRYPIAFLPSCHQHSADARRRQYSFDDLGTARCPKCGYPLVVRLNHRGPYFFCGCREKMPLAA